MSRLGSNILGPRKNVCFEFGIVFSSSEDEYSAPGSEYQAPGSEYLTLGVNSRV